MQPVDDLATCRRGVGANAARWRRHGRRAIRTFLDTHTGEDADQIRRIENALKEATASRFGVTEIPLGDGGINDDEVCLLIAPDADAVRNYHAALGVICGEVHEVSGLT